MAAPHKRSYINLEWTMKRAMKILSLYLYMSLFFAVFGIGFAMGKQKPEEPMTSQAAIGAAAGGLLWPITLGVAIKTSIFYVFKP